MIFLRNNPFSKIQTIIRQLHLFLRKISVKTYYLILLICLIVHQSSAMTLISPVREGSLIYGFLKQGESLFLGNTAILPTPNGQFFFGLPQDASSYLKLKLISNGREEIITFPVKKRIWNEEFITGLPNQKVSPSLTHQKRITYENKLIAKARTNFETSFFPTCFSRPLKTYKRISSHFGSRRILNNIKKAGHSGTDYAAPIGTPVYAPADGIVALTHSDMFLTGKTLLINHGYGLFSSYSHLDKITVKEGDRIYRGDLVGQVGTTGRSTGPHLHYVISWFHIRLDPEQLVFDYPCE